jgi:hypothetical protein
VPSWLVSKEALNAATYCRIAEGWGHRLVGEMKRRKCSDFFPLAQVAQGRPTVAAAPALFRCREEGGRVGQ